MSTKARIHPGDGDPRHGTANGYNNLGCRCDACRAAMRAYMREHAAGGYRRVPCPSCGEPKRPEAAVCRACDDAAREAPHGTVSRYKRCRCDACRAASNAARRANRAANLERQRAYDREYKRRRKAPVSTSPLGGE